MIPRSFLTLRTLSLIQKRSMARGRNYFIRGASRDLGISPESRDLLTNVKHSENIEEWQREPGIGDPINFKQYRENVEDFDDEKDLDMTYFPHKGQEPWPEDYEPSPVLMVKRVKHLHGEPWWHKQDCERIGLGIDTVTGVTTIALPNLSFYNALLYRIKHLVDIRAVQFPDGIPDKDEFDPRFARVTEDGQFLYSKKIAENSALLLGEGTVAFDELKVGMDTVRKKCGIDWNKPHNSPYGTSNYSRDLTVTNPEMKDHITDDSKRVKY